MSLRQRKRLNRHDILAQKSESETESSEESCEEEAFVVQKSGFSMVSKQVFYVTTLFL